MPANWRASSKRKAATIPACVRAALTTLVRQLHVLDQLG
jgi:hypothetical protein